MVQLQHLVLALWTLSSGALAQTCPTINPQFTPTWGSGFSGRVVVNGLSRPRGIAFDSQNNLLVVEAGTGVRYVKLTDNGGTDVCVGSSKRLISETGVSKILMLIVPSVTDAFRSAEPWYRFVGRWKDTFRVFHDDRLELPV